jgi:hypothetical protein
VRSLLAAAPTAIAIALLFIASWSNGAWALKSWGPVGVFVLTAVALAPHAKVRGAALAFAGLMIAFAAWTLLSAFWSDRPGEAIVGGGRALLYAGLVALPVLTLPSRPVAMRIGALVVAGAGALVVFTLISTLGDSAGAFLAGRLNDPVGYRNGTAALFALAFWPLTCVAAHRRAHPLLRALTFALAVIALAFAFLTQSRGVLIGFCCGGLTAFALGPDRLRRAWLAIFAIGLVAIASHRLLAPYDTFLDTARTDAAETGRAIDTVLLLALVGFAAALVVALFDGGLRVSAGAERAIARTAAIALALIVVAGGVAGLAAVGDPVSYVNRKADEFKQLDLAPPGETRLGSTSGQRYDLWRIAWHEFQAAPVQGGGEGAFAPRYFRERATDRNLTTPHSLAFSVLGDLGLVGAALLLGALGAAAVALVRGWPGAGPAERRLASGLAAAGVVVLTQSLVDWLWLIPGLAGLGLVCLATAVAIVSLPRAAGRPGGGRLRAVAWRAPYAAGAVIVALLFASDTYTRVARSDGTTGRLSAAKTAHTLNPWALEPRYLQASALEESGRVAKARAQLLEALDTEPSNFATMGLLGDLETRAGRTAQAKKWYRRALALNPRDVGLQQLAR